MNRIQLFAVLPLVLALSGCPVQTHMESRLYVVEGTSGVFTPTGEAGVYTLVTGGIRDEVTWFSDRPWRNAGEEDLSSFVEETWPAYFEGHEPAAGLAVRSADGVWSILTAQIHDAVWDDEEATLTWTVSLHGTPDLEPQTRILVYLDDKGALEADDESHVFVHAAAQAEFTEERALAAGQYRLTLAYPLPELIVLEAAPGYNAALERIDHFVDTSWPLDFDTDPPNAVVTIEDAEGNLESTPVMLSDPQWDSETDTLSYLARPLAGTPPAFAGPATMYIDSWDDREDDTIYQVVVNHEEQYSIWPADRELPLGWDAVGVTGTKQECLDYIEEVWTDMRPLSLRKKMEEAGLG